MNIRQVDMEKLKLGARGLALLKHWEQGPQGGFAAIPYKCSALKETIGWGHVIKSTDNFNYPISLAVAEALLKKDVACSEEAVNKNVKVPLTQNQFDALVCLVFNIGEAGFKSSTLLKFLNQGKFDLVPAQFTRWNQSNGKVLQGLANRRMSEVLLWQNPVEIKLYA